MQPDNRTRARERSHHLLDELGTTNLIAVKGCVREGNPCADVMGSKEVTLNSKLPKQTMNFGS